MTDVADAGALAARAATRHISRVTPTDRLDAVVVGAGPAGLATSAELSRRGVRHVVLERGPQLGHTWANLYDSLVLHTGRHLSHLPRMRFPRGTPLFPTRDHLLDYLRVYARRFEVPVEGGQEVSSLEREGNRWRVRTAAGTELEAGAVVVATGIVASPRRPRFAGEEGFRGRVMHSVEYRRPDEFVGRRVLVVGVGNSGGEIGSELARAGARVTMAVRSGADVVPLTLAGVPIQYFSYLLRHLPEGAQLAIRDAVRRLGEKRRGSPVLPRPDRSPLEGIPLIGFRLVDAIRDGLVEVRGALESFTERGVRFDDGEERELDDVILATGFTPAIAPLAGRVRTDARGFALRSDRVTSADLPGLYFVGHNYDSAGGLANIRTDAPLAAERIASR